jgi:hypothetical protein
MVTISNIYGKEIYRDDLRDNLYGAYLYGANLSDANLSDAYLSRANLSRANLSRANLSRANLSDANLSDARIREGIKLGGYIGQASRGDSYAFYAFAIADSPELFIFAGCRQFTTSEYRAHIAKSYPETDKARRTLACLAYLESLV